MHYIYSRTATQKLGTRAAAHQNLPAEKNLFQMVEMEFYRRDRDEWSSVQSTKHLQTSYFGISSRVSLFTTRVLTIVVTVQ